MGRKRVRKSRKAELTISLAKLPEDIVEEILLRLPARSIARFRAVSRSWRGLFSDPVFARAHHDHAPRAVLLRKRSLSFGGEWDEDIHTLPLGGRSATPLRLEEGHQRRVVLLGSCHGLLLLKRRVNHSFLVFNPTTREQVALPRHQFARDLAVAGFYFHAPTAEYRVLSYRTHIVPASWPKHYYAYSVAAVGRPEVRKLATTTSYGGYTRWKRNDAPVALRGCLHWMRKLHRVIVFDTVSETFRGMRGPMRDRCMVGRLVAMDDGTTLGASSFAEREATADVWVLQDYGKAEETWTLRYKVDVGFLGGGGIKKFKWLGIAHVSESGDALFYGARRFGVYNLRRGQVVSAGREIERISHLTATWHVYHESLVSLGAKDPGVDDDGAKDVGADRGTRVFPLHKKSTRPMRWR